MRGIARNTVVLFLLLGLVRAAAAEMGILIPAYFGWWDAAEWDRVKSAASRVKVVAVFNPGSGPGPSRDPNYAALVTSAKAAGVRMVGYVSTDYTNVSTASVKAQVDQYFTWYPNIDGIFFDEATPDLGTGGSNIAYY